MVLMCLSTSFLSPPPTLRYNVVMHVRSILDTRVQHCKGGGLYAVISLVKGERLEYEESPLRQTIVKLNMG